MHEIEPLKTRHCPFRRPGEVMPSLCSKGNVPSASEIQRIAGTALATCLKRCSLSSSACSVRLRSVMSTQAPKSLDGTRPFWRVTEDNAPAPRHPAGFATRLHIPDLDIDVAVAGRILRLQIFLSEVGHIVTMDACKGLPDRRAPDTGKTGHGCKVRRIVSDTLFNIDGEGSDPTRLIGKAQPMFAVGQGFFPGAALGEKRRQRENRKCKARHEQLRLIDAIMHRNRHIAETPKPHNDGAYQHCGSDEQGCCGHSGMTARADPENNRKQNGSRRDLHPPQGFWQRRKQVEKYACDDHELQNAFGLLAGRSPRTEKRRRRNEERRDRQEPQGIG